MHFNIKIQSFDFRSNLRWSYGTKSYKPDGLLMNSEVIQAIRQTGFVVFPSKNEKKAICTRNLGMLAELTIWIPSVTACKAVQQGSSSLCLLIIGRSAPHSLTLKTLSTLAICRGVTCRSGVWAQCCLHTHQTHTDATSTDYGSLRSSHVVCESMWCTHAVAW